MLCSPWKKEYVKKIILESSKDDDDTTADTDEDYIEGQSLPMSTSSPEVVDSDENHEGYCEDTKIDLGRDKEDGLETYSVRRSRPVRLSQLSGVCPFFSNIWESNEPSNAKAANKVRPFNLKKRRSVFKCLFSLILSSRNVCLTKCK